MKAIPFTHDSREVKLFAAGRRKKIMDKFDRVAVLAKNWARYERKLWTILRKESSQEAFACLVMAHTGIRCGNEGSAKGYVSLLKGMEGKTLQTYGLTTLEPRHVSIDGDTITLTFTGKRAVEQCITIKSAKLAKWGKLFLKENGAQWLKVTDREVYRFVQKKLSDEVNLKDFRTLCANGIAHAIYMDRFADRVPVRTKTMVNGELNDLLDEAAQRLGNTRGVIKRSYMTPHFVEWFKAERLAN